MIDKTTICSFVSEKGSIVLYLQAAYGRVRYGVQKNLRSSSKTSIVAVESKDSIPQAIDQLTSIYSEDDGRFQQEILIIIRFRRLNELFSMAEANTCV